nr:FAD:protein FMN transferase [Bacteroidales bacterium]
SVSGFNKESILSKYNNGEDVEFDDHFTRLVEAGKKYYAETEGAVDMGAGPLFDAWGFGFKNEMLPSDEQIRQLMDDYGVDNMDNPDSKVHPVLNFNAFAQGYTCDVLAAYLHKFGIHDMLIDLGEIWCDGLNQRGQPWSIAVDRPVDGNNTPGRDIDGVWVGDGKPHGVVTSGNYRKYYIVDGKKYAHIIDPRTGYPVQHSLLSATIVADDAMSADAYATYCMIIGPEAAKKFILSRSDLQAYLIIADDSSKTGMTEWTSPGFTLRTSE